MYQQKVINLNQTVPGPNYLAEIETRLSAEGWSEPYYRIDITEGLDQPQLVFWRDA